ncbi:MAG TPA: CBS domain-containing protein [Planctomycetaceae bacterium]|nr:CBS domain-containing protein [Planctomycetaceae bacterium]HIQ21364.1 CBS domain-containing protein [Planctomycetota bacterium]
MKDFTRGQEFWRAALRQLGRYEGTALSEYAAVVGLLLGCVTLAAFMLSHVIREPAVTLATWGHAQRVAGAANTSGQPTALRVRRDARPSSSPSKGGWLVGAVVLIGAAGIAAGTLLRRHLTVKRRSVLEAGANLSAEFAARFAVKRQQIYKILCSDPQRLFDHQIHVRDLMTDRLTGVSPSTSQKEVQQIMADNQMRHLLVRDAQGRLLGIISDRDIHERNGRTAADVMSPRPITVSPDTVLNLAISTMLANRISCLPVMDRGKPVGILTSTDLLMTLQCCMQLLDQIAQQVNFASDESEAAGRRAVAS